jgi:ABC-2 type transport system permease protein
VIAVIAAKELKSLFASPIAWVQLALLQLVFAWLFLIGLDRWQDLQPQLAMQPEAAGFTSLVIAPVYGSAAIVLMLAVPLLSMRLIAEERRNDTMPFLVSAPIAMWQIVLGKFVGLVAFLAISVGLVTLMCASLAAGGRPDWGLMAANVVGVLLLAASFGAIGLWMSSLTAQPVVAAIGTFALLLLLWIANLGTSDPASPLHLLSLLRHYESFARGAVNTGDLAWFVLVIVLFLALAVRRLDADRLRV